MPSVYKLKPLFNKHNRLKTVKRVLAIPMFFLSHLGTVGFALSYIMDTARGENSTMKNIYIEVIKRDCLINYGKVDLK